MRIFHNDIIDMPDVPGTNRDHDQRYLIRRDIAEIKWMELLERSEDPPDPTEGHAIIWLSDGTGAGDDGDIMVKVTAGGTTRSGTLIDFDVDLS